VTRIGVVAFTNTLPLAYELERFGPGLEPVPGTPAALAEGLENGSFDVGLVPVAALACHPEWAVVPGLGIAADGEVGSVLLLAGRPVEQIDRLVEDPASRTSNLLARLWLRERLGRDVPAEAGSPNLAERLAAGPTVAIGDDALFWSGASITRVDLAGAWREWTGLPFVFAVWAGPGANRPGLAAALAACHGANRARIPDLARIAAGDDDARRARVERYLTEQICYRLGPREEKGLHVFLNRCVEAGYLSAPVAANRIAEVGDVVGA